MDLACFCLYCEREYDSFSLVPHSLECGCTICPRCISYIVKEHQELICPWCKKFTKDCGIDQFVRNKLMQMCIIHNLPLAYYCDVGNFLVCAECHKEHPHPHRQKANEKTIGTLVNGLLTHNNSLVTDLEYIQNTEAEYEDLLQFVEDAEFREIKKIKQKFKVQKNRIFQNQKKLEQLKICIKESEGRNDMVYFEHLCNLQAIRKSTKDLKNSI